ncbi:MAG: NAD(+) synthase [Clostridiales bacterium]|nr:NAD(+) synthase [Clostridiales bacterium]
MQNFNAEQAAKDAVQWIRDWFEQNGKGCNAVVGISGGKDSSIVAALCAEALGKERVIGVLMPNGEQPDIDCSKQLVAYLGIPYYVCNVQAGVNGVLQALQDAGVEVSRQTTVNLPPRIRMSTLYALSQSNNGRVANTCNLSEDWVGYSTRYGDAAGDFAPLGKLTVQEVKAIGRYLGLPENLIEKVPSDGLTDRTDEDNLGFTYAVLDKYIRTGVCEDENTKARIDRLHALNEFKLKPIPCFEYQPK